MLEYISPYSNNSFLNKKVNRAHLDNNSQKSSTKDLLNTLKKMSQSTSLNSNDLPSKLEFKYSHTLNSTELTTTRTGVSTTSNHNQSQSNKKEKDISQFESYYKGTALIGGGLNNMGNTCFLNSVLQCLMYTLPIQNYLLNSEHVTKCKSKMVCFICELALIVKMLQERSSIAPYGIIRNAKLISKHIRIGRQEDAHEFFIFFLDSLEKAYNNYQKSTSNKFIVNSKGTSARNTNLIQNIFGGELSSEVVCLKCRNKSITNDQILTLSLEINNADSIERCLDNFCKSEPLFGSNKVFCDQCKTKNDSKKRFMFKALPNVLVIHLKRFDNYQRKIQKFIRYNNELDMQKYIIDNNDQSCNEFKYKLYAILIHNGYSAGSGHYYSFLKRSNGWLEMNDSMVQKVAESFALNQAPYMIFYQKANIASKASPPEVTDRKKEVVKKVYWQYDNININNIPVVYTNKRKKKAIKLSSMIRKMNKRNKGIIEYDDISQENHNNGSATINDSNHKSNGISISEHKEEIEGQDEGQDTYTLMMQNFGENLNKIEHQYNNSKVDEEDNDNYSDDESNNKKLNYFNKKNRLDNSNEKKLMIKSINLRSLYNSKNISLWDGDDEDKSKLNKGVSKVSEQVNFISKAQNHFKPHKIKTKSEYDIKLDKGKTKKIHMKSNGYHHRNYFQAISNNHLKQ